MGGLRAAWQAQTARLARWRRRNGVFLLRPRLPGIVHQGWGWDDGLSSRGAAAASLAIVLFVFSTAMYLLGASVMVSAAHEAAAATPTPPPPLIEDRKTVV